MARPTASICGLYDLSDVVYNVSRGVLFPPGFRVSSLHLPSIKSMMTHSTRDTTSPSSVFYMVRVFAFHFSLHSFPRRRRLRDLQRNEASRSARERAREGDREREKFDLIWDCTERTPGKQHALDAKHVSGSHAAKRQLGDADTDGGFNADLLCVLEMVRTCTSQEDGQQRPCWLFLSPESRRLVSEVVAIPGWSYSSDGFREGRLLVYLFGCSVNLVSILISSQGST